MKKLVSVLLVGIFIIFSYSCKHKDNEIPKDVIHDNDQDGNGEDSAVKEEISLPEVTEQEKNVAIQVLEEVTKNDNEDKKEAVKELKKNLANITTLDAGSFDGVKYYIWDLSKLGGKKFISSSKPEDNIEFDARNGIYDEIGPLVKTNNGLLARAKKGSKWGYITEKNIEYIHIPFDYDEVYSFKSVKGGLSPRVGSDSGNYYGCVKKNGKYTFLLSNGQSIDTDKYTLEYVPTGTYPNGFILEKYLVAGNDYRTQNSCAIFPFGNVKFNREDNNEKCTNKEINTISTNSVVQRTFYWNAPKTIYTEQFEVAVSTVKSCDYIKSFIKQHKSTKMQFVIYPIKEPKNRITCTYSE